MAPFAMRRNGLKLAHALPIVQSNSSYALMLKLALPVGIAVEWLVGPAVHSFVSIGVAGVRALMFAALAWLLLEAVSAAWGAVESLDD